MKRAFPAEKTVTLDFAALPELIVGELKRQNVTYEEMAIQIGVSLSTFKRMLSDPAGTRAANLHNLLSELGVKIWLEL